MDFLKIQRLILLAGIGQIALAVSSLTIPFILNWQAELSKVRPLIKQLFFTYAVYILVINLSFGLASVFAYRDLTNKTTLATLCTGFMAVYWLSRVSIQFLYFDRSDFPSGKLYKLGEAALVTLFIFLTVVYSTACYLNFRSI